MVCSSLVLGVPVVGRNRFVVNGGHVFPHFFSKHQSTAYQGEFHAINNFTSLLGVWWQGW